jgi:spermidine synthase
MASFQNTSTASQSILPKQYQDFTNKQYWNQFFQDLHEKAFEWYGSCNDIYPVISKNLSKDAKILMIGCGNSNLSSELYDLGYHNITNVDYSEFVIEEMIKKNQSTRPLMKWDVGDVTDLSALYTGEGFDVIIDKGTLDAIFSENSPELKAKSLRMFEEINRLLLKNTGIYICISLAQDYILDTLLEYFQNSWETEVSYLHLSAPAISTATDSNQQQQQQQHRSILQPFLFQFHKRSTSSASQQIRVSMDSLGNQYSEKEYHYLPSPARLMAYIQYIQDFHAVKHSILKLEIGKFEILNLWSSSSDSSSVAANNLKEDSSSVGESINQNIPRYTLYILDANEQGKLSMAVFIIPYGREADFQFTSKEGLLDIAFQANCKRLIAVSCNRPYPYPAMKDLQDELSPVILSLKFSSMEEKETIPYMAVNEDNSWEVIAQGESKLSGIYIIEEKAAVEEEEGEEAENNNKKPNSIYRRLIFLQNQQFIQTEVRLILESYQKEKQQLEQASSSKKKSNSGKDKKKGNKSKGGNKSEKKSNNNNTSAEEEGEMDVVVEDRYVYDYTYLDDHHKGFLVSCCLNGAVMDFVTKKTTSSPSAPSCLVIGLGGGSLPMTLQKYYPFLEMTALEIDGSVSEIAGNYFDFHFTNPNSQVVVEDGIKFVNQKHQEQQQEQQLEKKTSYQLIMIDVDSKDPSLGLSAPPKEFISNDFLYKIYSLLSNDGILLINTVARSKDLFNQLIDRLKIIFQVFPGTDYSKGGASESQGRILQLQATKENVNVGLICMKNATRAFPVTAGKDKQKSLTKNQLEIKLQVQLEQTVNVLLQVIFFLLVQKSFFFFKIVFFHSL